MDIVIRKIIEDEVWVEVDMEGYDLLETDFSDDDKAYFIRKAGPRFKLSLASTGDVLGSDYQKPTNFLNLSSNADVTIEMLANLSVRHEEKFYREWAYFSRSISRGWSDEVDPLGRGKDYYEGLALKRLQELGEEGSGYNFHFIFTGIKMAATDLGVELIKLEIIEKWLKDIKGRMKKAVGVYSTDGWEEEDRLNDALSLASDTGWELTEDWLRWERGSIRLEMEEIAG